MDEEDPEIVVKRVVAPVLVIVEPPLVMTDVKLLVEMAEREPLAVATTSPEVVTVGPEPDAAI